jgi:hypothetical protein
MAGNIDVDDILRFPGVFCKSLSIQFFCNLMASRNARRLSAMLADEKPRLCMERRAASRTRGDDPRVGCTHYH